MSETPKIHFHHVRDKTCPNGGKTLALELNSEGLVTAYAVAWCHEKDNFCKRTGRVKSAGRLKSRRYRRELTTPLSLADVLKATTW